MRMRRAVLWTVLSSTIGLFTFAGCGSDSTPTTPSTPVTPADVTVSIVADRGNQSYAPNPVQMRVGQTIAWKNADPIAHTATGDAGQFNTGLLNNGATSNPIAMNTAGTFTYHCTVHPGMVGTVVVQ